MDALGGGGTEDGEGFISSVTINQSFFFFWRGGGEGDVQYWRDRVEMKDNEKNNH